MFFFNVVIYVFAGKVGEGVGGSVGKGRREMGKGYIIGAVFRNVIILGIFNIVDFRWLFFFYLVLKCGGFSFEFYIFFSFVDLIFKLFYLDLRF